MGLILVFDLDYTIVDTQESFFEKEESEIDALSNELIKGEYLNPTIIAILQRACRLRYTKGVTAICLLTNNSDPTYVAAVDSAIYTLCNKSTGKYQTEENIDDDALFMPRKPYFFDAIMMRQHSTRGLIRDPPKSIKDVKIMMSYLGEKIVLDTIYFFDDLPHELDRQLTTYRLGEHSIKINPGFKRGQRDLTNYQPILNKLSTLDGISVPPSLPVSPLTVRRSSPPALLGNVGTSTRPPYRSRSGAVNNGDPSALPTNLPPPQGNLNELPQLRGSPAFPASLRRPPSSLSHQSTGSSGGTRRRRKRGKKNSKKTRDRLRK